MIKLYDSKTKKMVTLNENDISMYNCGPTVYNHIHIGNARPLVTFDVLYRLLIHFKKNVTYVLNITDIDDKIINNAIQNNVPELELSNYYTEQYFLIKKKLNTLPMINPKVSENIDGIIEYIEKIVSSGYGYYIEGNDVYFDTSKIKTYGSVSNQNMDALFADVRIKNNESKQNPHDFVLWKRTEHGLQWATKWFKGRPGWHTECAYLINKLIGHQATIHGGGMDLKFPHHENENAQNQALFNCDIAKVWLHIAMINIDNEKMSKSLNNFILVKDILEKYSYQALRWFFYQSNYSNPLNYSDQIMEQMENEVLKFKKTINDAKTLLVLNNQDFSLKNEQVNNDVIEYLSDNLNLINAITVLYDLNKKLNILIRQKDLNSVEIKLAELINSLKILGIEFENLHNDENITLLKEWDKLVKLKEFTKSDFLRKKLIEKGLL